MSSPINLNFIPLDLQARTETLASPDQDNTRWRGVRLYLGITAAAGTSPTLDVKVQTKDPATGAYIDLAGGAFAQKTGTGEADLVIYPGVAETANVSVSDILARIWRVLATIAGTTAAADVVTLTSDATNPDPTGTILLGTAPSNKTYTLVAALTEAKALSTLTGDGTIAATGSTVTIGTRVYTYRTTLTETRASVTLTSSVGNTTDGGTLILGFGKYRTVYTFRDTLTAAQNEIKIGATAAITLDNVKAAINASGTPGTEYSAVQQHPQIDATTNTNTTQLFIGRTGGGFEFQSGNQLESNETAVNLAFGSVTFVGGVDPIADEVLRVTDDDTCLANLDKAINATGTAGTEYSTGTTINTQVSSAVAANVLTATALVVGVASNSIVTTASSVAPDSHQDWADTTLGGGAGASTPGADSVANEIFIGISAAVTLDNIKSAINGTAGAGTAYSSATVAHTTIEATTNTDTTQVFASRAGVPHAVADALASTEAATHLAFGATTLGGGADTPSFTFAVSGSYLV